MAKKIGPNVLCRVISGNQGPSSPNVGRHVMVMHAHPNPHPHSLWDKIWVCRSLDGRPFKIKRDQGDVFGSNPNETSAQADFPEDWLEPIEEDPDTPKVQEKEQDLIN